jgi:hypothetical protein
MSGTRGSSVTEARVGCAGGIHVECHGVGGPPACHGRRRRGKTQANHVFRAPRQNLLKYQGINGQVRARKTI